MQREISYEWSPELVRLGTRRFISRRAGRSLIVFAVMVFSIAALTAGRMLGEDGRRFIEEKVREHGGQVA